MASLSLFLGGDELLILECLELKWGNDFTTVIWFPLFYCVIGCLIEQEAQYRGTNIANKKILADRVKKQIFTTKTRVFVSEWAGFLLTT